jgi:transcriptional regulator with XRE-family HTH domain
METETWRDRLRAEIDKAGASKRSLSLKADMGAGYVHSILEDGKDPGLESLMKVCAALDVSLLRIVYGLDVTPEMEEVFHLWRQSSSETRSGIVQILRSSKGPVSSPAPPKAAPATARPRPQKARS